VRDAAPPMWNGPHRELRARLADRLRGDDAHRLADVHQRAAAEVAAVALRADAVARVAGERRAHLDLVDAERLDLLDRVLVEELAATSTPWCSGCITSLAVTRPRMRSRSASTTSPPSTSAFIAMPATVPQSSSITTRSCVTSTRRRVR
jgi:hypothetical protein